MTALNNSIPTSSNNVNSFHNLNLETASQYSESERGFSTRRRQMGGNQSSGNDMWNNFRDNASIRDDESFLNDEGSLIGDTPDESDFRSFPSPFFATAYAMNKK